MRENPADSLLANQVRKILFVLIANGLEQIAVQQQNRINLYRPRLGIGLRIVECELDVHVPEVPTVKALDHSQSFRMGVAGKIEPGFVVEARRFDHQRVAFPVAQPSSPSRKDSHPWKGRGRR